MIDILVRARLHAHDPGAVVQMRPVEHIVNIDVTSLAAAVANRGGAGHVPNPGLETEITFGQGTDGTDVNDIAGHLRCHTLFYIGADLHVFTTAGTTQLTQPGDFLTETYTAGAMDTTGHVRLDQGTDVLVRHHPL